jgi:hypothetical protein
VTIQHIALLRPFPVVSCSLSSAPRATASAGPCSPSAPHTPKAHNPILNLAGPPPDDVLDDSPKNKKRRRGRKKKKKKGPVVDGEPNAKEDKPSAETSAYEVGDEDEN